MSGLKLRAGPMPDSSTRGPARREVMTEASWIVRDALARAMKEYQLTHAELTAIVIQELSGWTKAELEQEWGEGDE
jgi:hypothetical protein